MERYDGSTEPAGNVDLLTVISDLVCCLHFKFWEKAETSFLVSISIVVSSLAIV